MFHASQNQSIKGGFLVKGSDVKIWRMYNFDLHLLLKSPWIDIQPTTNKQWVKTPTSSKLSEKTLVFASFSCNILLMGWNPKQPPGMYKIKPYRQWDDKLQISNWLAAVLPSTARIWFTDTFLPPKKIGWITIWPPSGCCFEGLAKGLYGGHVGWAEKSTEIVVLESRGYRWKLKMDPCKRRLFVNQKSAC